jgi:hypothetical protein
VAYYPFDESLPGPIADASGNGNHGADRSFSVTDAVPGVHGLGLEFGQAGWFEVAASPSLDSITRGFTVATWLTLPMLVVGRGVLVERLTDGAVNYAVTLDDGVLSMTVGSTSCSVPMALTAHRWQHVSASYDGSQMQVLFDGKRVMSCPAGDSISASTAPLTVGASVLRDGVDKLRANLDDLALWSRALDADALAALAAGDTPS